MPLRQVLHQLDLSTPGRGFTRIDRPLNAWLRTTGLHQGVLHLTCLHTSASLTINENADPRVLQDLEAWMADVVPESRPYVHNDEGADDMPAHIRTALTSQTMSLSVQDGRLVLGTWQAVYLWEHRSAPHQRTVACHLMGEEQPLARETLRINETIQSRHDAEAWASDGGVETEVDFLVDRLHDLADKPSQDGHSH